jgi:hypothetical protein
MLSCTLLGQLRLCVRSCTDRRAVEPIANPRQRRGQVKIVVTLFGLSQKYARRRPSGGVTMTKGHKPHRARRTPTKPSITSLP